MPPICQSPVYHTEHPPKLTTALVMVDMQLQNFSMSKVCDKVLKESTLIFEIPKFSSNTSWG